MPKPTWSAGFVIWLASLAVLASPPALAQTLCNSDGQPAPTALLERFISADCAACWRDDTTPVALDGVMAVDWIVPAAVGEDAPLAAVASRDALARLHALHQPVPLRQSSLRSVLQPLPQSTLRVAHGLALGGYVGASIELRLPAGATAPLPLRAWLVLAETLPVGTEQTPVARNLARNVFQPTWEKPEQLHNQEQLTFKELRAIAIPSGTRTERMRLLGWVEDANGDVLATAQSVCRPDQDD